MLIVNDWNTDAVALRPEVLQRYFIFSSVCVERGRPYKLFVPRRFVNTTKHYFCVRVIEPWNNLNCASVDFSSALRRFKCFLRRPGLSQYLKHSGEQISTFSLLIFYLNVSSFHVCFCVFLNFLRDYVSGGWSICATPSTVLTDTARRAVPQR